MISHYVAHCIRGLALAGTLQKDQIAKMLDIDADRLQAILDGSDGKDVDIQVADRFAEMFGMDSFRNNFCRSLFGPEQSLYKTWEDLEKPQREMVNLGSVFVASNRSAITAMAYTKESEYFLESCSDLLSVIKQDDGNYEDADDKEEA